jgi:ATP phosphoribosyltransferase
MKNKRIKIAIQKNGRLTAPSLDFLASIGLRFIANGRSLIQKSECGRVELILLRDDDIPECVNLGIADFAIIGENVLLEKEKCVEIVRELDFARCALMLAVPENLQIKNIKELDGKRIATTYPKILEKYFKEMGIEVSIVPMAGSVEIAPELGIADAICDIVETGGTLKAHNLKPFCTVLDSKAILIANSTSLSTKVEMQEILSKQFA